MQASYWSGIWVLNKKSSVQLWTLVSGSLEGWGSTSNWAGVWPNCLICSSSPYMETHTTHSHDDKESGIKVMHHTGLTKVYLHQAIPSSREVAICYIVNHTGPRLSYLSELGIFDRVKINGSSICEVVEHILSLNGGISCCEFSKKWIIEVMMSATAHLSA